MDSVLQNTTDTYRSCGKPLSDIADTMTTAIDGPVRLFKIYSCRLLLISSSSFFLLLL
jgi:hypothetical protein